MIFFNFIFYSIVCAIFLLLFNKREDSAAKAGIVIYSICTVLWLWAILSFREPVGDPWRYMLGLNYVAQLEFSELIDYDKIPFGFKLLNWLTASISTSSVLFFSVIYAFCVIPLYLAFRERVDKTDAAILTMLYLLYPFYLNYLGSGFKQGIGFGFMLWGLNYILDRKDPKWIRGLLLLFIATLFHTSFWLVNIVFVAWYFIFRKKSLSWSVSVLIFSALLALAGLVERIANALIPSFLLDSLSFNEYFDGTFTSGEHFKSLNYVSGFRADFAIFTFIPIICLLLIRRKYASMKGSDDIVKIYCLLASVYFMLSFIPFSDRVASFSWFLIPFMLFTQLGRLNFKNYKDNLVYIITISYPLLMITYTKVHFQ